MPTPQLLTLEHERAASDPDVIFLGDSFVETGRGAGGWLELAGSGERRLQGWGFSGACPSQYLLLHDRLRSEGFTGRVVIVLYVGNDWADDAVWASSTDPRDYPDLRRRFYGDPASPAFWPCFEADGSAEPASWFARRWDLYRRWLSLAVPGALARLTDAARDQRLEAMMASCDHPPYSEMVDGRLFFFSHHEALMRPVSATEGASREPLIEALARRREAGPLSVVVVLDREEVCARFHGKPVTEAAPFIEALAASGVEVWDPNSAFERACSERQLYLPDGHWNEAGHALFAREVGRWLALEDERPRR